MLTAQLAYSVWTGGDAWEELGYANRYVATVLPLPAVLGGIGVAALAAFGRRELRPVAVIVAAAAGLGGVAIVFWEFEPLTAAFTGAWQPGPGRWSPAVSASSCSGSSSASPSRPVRRSGRGAWRMGARGWWGCSPWA
jgi:hypothetical protein